MYKSKRVQKIMQLLVGLDDKEYLEFAEAHKDFVGTRTRLAASQFRPGQLVEFSAKGSHVRMRVRKIGPKNVLGIEESRDGKKSLIPTRWRVHPAYLKLVTY